MFLSYLMIVLFLNINFPIVHDYVSAIIFAANVNPKFLHNLYFHANIFNIRNKTFHKPSEVILWAIPSLFHQ